MLVEAEVVSNKSITFFLPYPCTKFVNPYTPWPLF